MTVRPYLWSIGSYTYRGAIWTGLEWSFDRQTQPKYYPTLAEAMAALETIEERADAYITREL